MHTSVLCSLAFEINSLRWWYILTLEVQPYAGGTNTVCTATV